LPQATSVQQMVGVDSHQIEHFFDERFILKSMVHRR